MEDVPKPESLDANQVLMAASRRLGKQKMLDVASDALNEADEADEADDPIYIAVVYRRHLIHIEESEPLYGISYYGQAVRSVDEYDEPIDVARARWREEKRDTKTRFQDKKVGLPVALNMFGEDAFEDTVLHYMVGRVSVVQPWADKMEKKVISDNGGVLQNMHKRLNQTLNLDKGGKGYNSFLSQVAFRNECFEVFKEEMEAYVECYGTSLVSTHYTNPTTGYNLWSRLRGFRTGDMRRGMPNRIEIENWAECLAKWSWNSRETDEYRLSISERSAAMWKDPDKKEQIIASLVTSHHTLDFRAKSSESQRMSQKKKQIERLNKMESKDKKIADSLIASRARADLKKTKDLEILRLTNPTATRKDLVRARAEGFIPNRRKEKQQQRDSMNLEQRLVYDETIRRERESTERKRVDLEELRKVWPRAIQKDLPRARREGLIPNRNKDRSKRKKRVTTTTTTTTKTVTEYKTESESSDEEEEDIESILGSSSSAPLPKRRRRDADSDSD